MLKINESLSNVIYFVYNKIVLGYNSIKDKIVNIFSNGVNGARKTSIYKCVFFNIKIIINLEQ